MPDVVYAVMHRQAMMASTTFPTFPRFVLMGKPRIVSVG